MTTLTSNNKIFIIYDLKLTSTLKYYKYSVVLRFQGYKVLFQILFTPKFIIFKIVFFCTTHSQKFLNLNNNNNN